MFLTEHREDELQEENNQKLSQCIYARLSSIIISTSGRRKGSTVFFRITVSDIVLNFHPARVFKPVIRWHNSPNDL